MNLTARQFVLSLAAACVLSSAATSFAVIAFLGAGIESRIEASIDAYDARNRGDRRDFVASLKKSELGRRAEANQSRQTRADRKGHQDRENRPSIHVPGDLRIDGVLEVGDNTLSLVNNVVYPPGNITSDLILSDVAAAGVGRIGLVRANTGDFAGIEVGIGTGDPQHKLHIHNGPLPPFGFVPRSVEMAFTTDATGGTATDGLLIGIDVNGNAQITQQEQLPLTIAAGGGAGVTILPSGDVGVGTSPAARLHVGGAAGVDGIMFPDGTLQTTAAAAPVTVPIGGAVAWLKSLSGTPVPLPAAFVECNGQTITDPQSPYNGISVPDLNGHTTERRFLRGSSASGATGGSPSHTHQINNNNPFDQLGGIPSAAAQTTTSGSSLPPFYEVVWIMRVK